jgi:hypothetical protein
MQNEHFIPGKDASLEHSITSMQAKLSRARLRYRGMLVAQPGR